VIVADPPPHFLKEELPMRYFRILGAGLCFFFLYGCFQAETVIRVKPDGSGVVEETLLLSKDFLESFQEIIKGFDEGKGDNKNQAAKEKEDPIQGMIRDARARESHYGPEVKFISAVPLRTETMGGYKAVYAFKDINTLKVNQNPGKKAEKAAAGEGALPAKEENVTFKLVKGPVSTLTVMMPKDKKEKKKAQGQIKETQDPGQADPQALEQMKAFFKDMGLRVAIEIDGTILKTNALYRKNSEITLVELHFGRFLENKDLLEKLMAAPPKSIEEARELIKGIEGLKIETANPLIVEFK
jgi:hypothetical protein